MECDTAEVWSTRRGSGGWAGDWVQTGTALEEGACGFGRRETGGGGVDDEDVEDSITEQ